MGQFLFTCVSSVEMDNFHSFHKILLNKHEQLCYYFWTVFIVDLKSWKSQQRLIILRFSCYLKIKLVVDNIIDRVSLAIVFRKQWFIVGLKFKITSFHAIVRQIIQSWKSLIWGAITHYEYLVQRSKGQRTNFLRCHILPAFFF